MNFLRRLNGTKKNLTSPTPPKIRFNWQTWVAPMTLLLANFVLILPLFGQSASGISEYAVLAAYILGPVFFYFYVWELTNRRLTSFLAALIYTIPTFRLSQIIIYDDALHVVALGLVPLVLICFLRFLRLQTLNLAIISAIGIALVALISPFGLFTLLIFLGTVTYSEMLLGKGRMKLFSTLLILVTAAGLVAFRYHPAFVLKIFSGDHGKALISLLWNVVPISFFLVPVAGAFSFLIFDRRPNLQPLFLAGSSFSVFFVLFCVGNYISTVYIPVPSRFLPELCLSFAFLMALILAWLLGVKLRLSPKLSSGLNKGLLVFLLTFLLVSIFFLRAYYWQLVQTETAILGVKTIESDGGISQVLGLVITILTSLLLVLVKWRTKFLRASP